MFLKHIVVNVTEHDPMHARLMMLKNIEEIAVAGANERVVALVWECPDDIVLNAQLEVLWNESIPARIVEDNETEISFVNSIINSVLSDEIF